MSDLAGDGRRTREIFNFIIEFLETYGYAPSTREIGVGTNIKSTGVINYHLKKLIETGYLRRPRPGALIVEGGEFHFYGDRP